MLLTRSNERMGMDTCERERLGVWKAVRGQCQWPSLLRRLHLPARSHASAPPRWATIVGALLLLMLAVPFAAYGQAYMTQTGHAEFTSSVPLHTFTGTSDHLVGKISLPDSTVDFYLDLTTLETGIGKRDKDMRTTLETDEYPFAEFFGTLVTPFDPARREPQPATVRGEFSLHGVTRDVTIDGTLQMTPEGLQLEAAWEINLNDYNIEPPSLLIVRVDEIQQVRIEALLEPVDESS